MNVFNVFYSHTHAGKEFYMAKPKLWLGLAGVGALLTTTVFAGQRVADDNAGLINDALKLTAQKIDKIDSDLVEGSAYADEDGSLSNDGWKEMIKDSYKFCEELVEQGSALLKNDNGALPLKENERNITLLGQGSKSLFMRSGAGGAAPNESKVVNLVSAFEEKCGFNVNHTLYDKYTEYKQSDFLLSDNGPIRMVEHAYSDDFYNDEVKNSFAKYGDAAIVTFMRIGTENVDPSDGQLELSSDERKLLELVRDYKANGTFKKVIVLINSPLPMAVDWAMGDDYGVDALLFIGVPGYYGIEGAVHVLMGKDRAGNVVNPSGHLPDTFAASAASSPAYINWGQSSIAVYSEGVYVGY